MKKNLFLVLALGTAIVATSCDQNNTTNTEATVAEEATYPAGQSQVDNPNIASAEATTATAASSANAPVITFKNTEYDFGTIKQGQVVEHTFEFTNTGKSPLIIESTSAPCGCTVPEHTKDPVAPGKTGSIKVVFNSTGKNGQQSPTVTVRANTEPNISQVYMRGTVEASSYPATAGSEGPVIR